ncbi:MAG: NosD domain-containing protein, partial [Candidatus Heimdallarchaeota archaeon]
MRNKSKLKIIITIFGIIFAFLTISNLNLVDNSFNNDGTAENQDESHSRNPKISGYWTTNFIHVDGNWSDTATVYDWCSGDGSWGNPYTIENVIIDASSSPTGSGILINNSKNEYFIIRNCTVYNAFAGIWLENTDNGTLTLNNCTSNSRGIRLRNNCKNNIIANNMADGNSLVGIILEFNCDNNNISGNSANGPIQIRGIRLRDYCDNNIISGNSVNDNDLYGIYLNYYCDDNTISGNTANGNNRGIFLTDRCDGNTISG